MFKIKNNIFKTTAKTSSHCSLSAPDTIDILFPYYLLFIDYAILTGTRFINAKPFLDSVYLGDFSEIFIN